MATRETGRWTALLAVLLWASPILAQDAPDSAHAFAETLYFENVPFDEASQLSDADVRRLAGWLEDATRTEQHPNIVIGLGMSGNKRAYRALRRYAKRAPKGAVESAQYRARMAIPIAMGHLARSDHRALRYLARELRRPRPVQWTYRHLDEERLAAMLLRARVSGLGISGLPKATAELESLARRENPKLRSAKPREKWDGHLDAAMRMCARVAQEGPSSVFGGEL